MCKEKLNKELATQVLVDSDNTSDQSNMDDSWIQIVETQKNFTWKNQ